MSNLQQMMNEYTANEMAAARNPAEFPFTARPGIEMSIREAKDKMEGLEKAYKDVFLAAAVAIFLDGPKASQLASYKGALTVDAEALYRRVADQVDQTIGSGRTFTANQASRALSVLRDIGVELHIASFKHIDFGPAVEVPTYTDTLAVIRNGIRKVLSDDLNRMYIEAAIVRQALTVKFAGNSAPVFIVNALSDEVAGLSAAFGKGSVAWTVAADAEVNDEYVSKLIKEVTRRITKKK